MHYVACQTRVKFEEIPTEEEFKEVLVRRLNREIQEESKHRQPLVQLCLDHPRVTNEDGGEHKWPDNRPGGQALAETSATKKGKTSRELSGGIIPKAVAFQDSVKGLDGRVRVAG